MGCSAYCRLLQDAIRSTQLLKNKKVPDYTKIIEESNSDKMSIGIPKEYFFDCLQPEVEDVFHDFIDAIRSMGITVSDINLQESDKIYESWRSIRLGESAEIHSKWLQTRPEDYGEDVLKMLIQGTEVSAVITYKLIKFRKEVRNAFMKVLKNVDVVIVPTTILTAPSFDEPTVSIRARHLKSIML